MLNATAAVKVQKAATNRLTSREAIKTNSVEKVLATGQKATAKRTAENPRDTWRYPLIRKCCEGWKNSIIERWATYEAARKAGEICQTEFQVRATELLKRYKEIQVQSRLDERSARCLHCDPKTRGQRRAKLQKWKPDAATLSYAAHGPSSGSV